MIKEVKYTISWLYAKKILMNKKLWDCFKKRLAKDKSNRIQSQKSNKEKR